VQRFGRIYCNWQYFTKYCGQSLRWIQNLITCSKFSRESITAKALANRSTPAKVLIKNPLECFVLFSETRCSGSLWVRRCMWRRRVVTLRMSMAGVPAAELVSCILSSSILSFAAGPTPTRQSPARRQPRHWTVHWLTGAWSHRRLRRTDSLDVAAAAAAAAASASVVDWRHALAAALLRRSHHYTISP